MSFKEIANSLNSYVESKDNKYLDEIENTFKSIFDSEFVKFWAYDSRDEKLLRIQDSYKKSITLDTSLIKESIDSKSAVTAKHVISDKSYVQKIDNPLNLKAKALLVFPVLKDEKVIGVLRLTKGMKQKKVFTRQDEKKLETFMPILVKIIEKSSIDKEELLSMSSEDVSKNVSSKIEKKAVKDKVEKKDKVNSNDVNELNTLKKKILSFEESEEKYRKEIEKFKNELENSIKSTQELEKELALYMKKDKENSDLLSKLNSLEKKILSYNKSEEKYKKEIDKEKSLRNESEKNYLKLEASALELSNLVAEHQNAETKLSKEVDLLIAENKLLEKDLKKNSAPVSKSIKELKAENALISKNNSIDIEKNIEKILEYVAPNFGDNEKLHLLFGLIIYAIHSKVALKDMENILNKSKVLPEMINDYYFKVNIKIYSEKELMSDISKSIEKSGNMIFGSKKINIKNNDDLPVSLIFDGAKIKNIVYHLLDDMYQFVDYSKNINIIIGYKNKLLTIKISGSIHEKNSLFKSMFNQTKFGGNEKDRLGLLLSKKLIEVLKGNIESIYDKEQYTFMIKLPAQIIKM